MHDTDGFVLTRAEALECLKGLARRTLEMPPEQIGLLQLDTPLVEGLDLDSLKQVVLMASLEESFGFEFSPGDLDRVQGLETVGDLASLLSERATMRPAWN